MTTLSPLEIARQYLARGWAVLPIPGGTKRPILHGWQTLRLSAADLERRFQADENVGILLGEPSGGLVDVDLDHPLAVELAPQYLPATAAIFGRSGKPSSHWLFLAAGAETHKRQAGEHGMLVELRSTGCQTVFPYSLHPSGERIEWQLPGEPATVDAAELLAAVDRLADDVSRQLGIEPTAKLSVPQFTQHGGADAVERCRRYVAKMPPAISGQGGHNATYNVACELFRFGLAESDAGAVLAEYNARCVPPWSDSELAHKLTDARKEVLAKGEYGIRLRDTPPRGAFMPHAAAVEAEPDFAAMPDDPGPIPDALLAVPGFIGEVVAYNLSGAIRPQPVLALAGALSLLAVLTGRKITDRQRTRTNLFCIATAGTSTGKNYARVVNKDILHAAGMTEFLASEGIGSAQGLVAAVEAQPAILFQLDEFGRYLKTMTDQGQPHLYNVMAVLNRMFTDAASTFKSDAVVDAKRVKTIYNPHACLYATTTPDALYNSLTTESLQDGFLSRIMLFEAIDVAPRRVNQLLPPQSLVDQARWWFEFNPGGNLSGQNPQPLIVDTTPAAEQKLTDFMNAAEAEKKRLGEPLGSLWPRAAEKANKMALLWACSENACKPEISEEGARWACDMVSHLTTRLVYLASRWLSENRTESEVKRLYRKIEAAGPGGLSKSEITRATQYLKARDRNEHLDTLVQSGQIVARTRPGIGRKDVHAFIATAHEATAA